MFKVEDLVVVTGLKKDKDLNGAMGIVVGHAPDKVDKSITRHKVSTYVVPPCLLHLSKHWSNLRISDILWCPIKMRMSQQNESCPILPQDMKAPLILM